MKKKVSKFDKLSVYVIFSIALLVIYTVVTMLITIWEPGYLNDTLTTCVYGTFGGELLMCCVLKALKIKKGDEENESDSDGFA